MSAWLVNLIKQSQWPDDKILQTWPATIIQQYYYEKELYTEAICLCDKSISELRIAKIKNEENSVEFQLAICLDGIRSLFRYISNENDNNILEHEFDDEIVQRNRVLPHSSSSSDDGLLASLFNYYAHEEQCLDPKDYRNDYLKSFFAGNGSLQIGPFNRTPPSWDNF